MAHFTGLKELQNHPHKAGFDIGSKNIFTAKVGELLPVYWDMAIPGCDYDIDLAYFTRTRPVQSAAYTRIREYFDFYAVPCRIFLATSSESKKNKIWKCGRNVLGEYSDTTYEDIFSYEPIFVNKYLRKRFAKS